MTTQRVNSQDQDLSLGLPGSEVFHLYHHLQRGQMTRGVGEKELREKSPKTQHLLP